MIHVRSAEIIGVNLREFGRMGCNGEIRKVGKGSQSLRGGDLWPGGKDWICLLR